VIASTRLRADHAAAARDAAAIIFIAPSETSVA
jgi:hypothetical protein